MRTIFKVCIEFVTKLFPFYVILWGGAFEAWRILVLQPGIEPTTPALEGKVLTTGPPGKSLDQLDSELRTPDLKKRRQEEAVLVVAAAASVQSIEVQQCWPHQADVAARFSLSGHPHSCGEYVFAASQQLCEHHWCCFSKFLFSLKQLDCLRSSHPGTLTGTALFDAHLCSVVAALTVSSLQT